uniref:Pyrin domain-containing protein n=1 Tax=Sphaeramia orbicularis TaxID=375764 RepID=A0A673A055_9TELE
KIEKRFWKMLLDTLEDLTEGDFKKFKWFLQQAEILEGFPAVPKSQLENADRLDTVDQILDTYQDHAVEVIIKVFESINRHLWPRNKFCLIFLN